ncbi:dihydrofolate reductase [Mycoplasma sp. ATU-Cv-508]|uniref:dihydrofolate reductase n=1 Tax=Mycoplasma sp. ATU-Cv-508 TaxID=2048001 RepID=UPI000FDF0F93
MAWKNPAELAFFRRMTLGQSLLWGQNTFANLPGRLTDRTHYVLSDRPLKNADHILNSTDQVVKLFEKFDHDQKDIFISGGKSVYEQFYPYAQEIYVSQVDTKAQGDVFLKIDLSKHRKDLFFRGDGFEVFLYRKKFDG